MTSIRAVERDDLPQVASLFERVLSPGSRTPAQERVEYFERTLLEHPWADPELPSLVGVDGEGRIVGFIATSVRRMRFDDRPVRVVGIGHLMADPDFRGRPVGALLMRAVFGGPQELTITDGANDASRRIWEGLGGHPSFLSCVVWTRPFRPWQFARDRLLRRRRGESDGRGAARPLWSALDAATGRLPFFSAPPEPEGSTEPLTPRALVEHLPSVADSLRLRPDYDEPFLDWLFAELREQEPELVALLVRDKGGEAVGWFVYQLKRGGGSQVLQVAARDGAVDAVLDHLFHHAHANGAAAIQGRLEPRLLAPLSKRRCVFHYSGEALIHSRHPEIVCAALSGQALLTRLEGEWWE